MQLVVVYLFHRSLNLSQVYNYLWGQGSITGGSHRR